MTNYTTAEEAVKKIKSEDRVFIHSVAAAPQTLIKAMTARANKLKNVEIVHIHTEGETPYAAPGMQDSFRVNCLFIGANMREAVQSGRAFFTPNFLSEVPHFFRHGILPLNVAMVQVSPPDRHGFCSLGVSVDVAHAAVDSAQCVIAQVNPQMPRTHGDGIIHISRFDAVVEVNEPIAIHTNKQPSLIENQIGQHIAGITEDGATLQMGIGAIPDAVLQYLGNHKNLGIHSEMFSDGLVDLVAKGVVNGVCKKIRPEKIVSGFVMGSRKVYDFIDDNPQVELLDISYINNPMVILQNPKVTAINSAIEVDITGQICADSIGSKMYSGVGGQMDFIRGASLSQGGKPIIALPSQTGHGISRIVPTLTKGAGVVTTRAHAHYIITEYGIAYLYGKTLQQRAKAMIGIAHPDHRERLDKEAWEMFNNK